MPGCKTSVGGSIRAFGVANSQVTSPVVDAISAAMVTVDVPTDDREIEVLFASIAFAVSSGWVMLQVYPSRAPPVPPINLLLSLFVGRKLREFRYSPVGYSVFHSNPR